MKLFLILILFISLYYCCSLTYFTNNTIVNCLNLNNGSQICSINFQGSILFNGNEEFCAELKINGTSIGTIEIRILKIIHYPHCPTYYWTSSYQYKNKYVVIRNTPFHKQFYVSYNSIPTYCDENNGQNRLNQLCYCYYGCRDPNYDTNKLKNRGCQDILDLSGDKSINYQYMGDTGCHLYPDFIDYYFSAYSFAIIPNENEVFMVKQCHPDIYEITLQIDFSDTSGTNLNKKHNFFPDRTQEITYKINSLSTTNQKVGGITFFSESFNKITGILPSNFYFLIPPIDNNNQPADECYYINSKYVSPQQLPEYSKVGDIQSNTLENLLYKSNTPFQIETGCNYPDYNCEQNKYSNGKLEATTSLFRISTSGNGINENYFSITNFDNIISQRNNNISVFDRLPYGGGEINKYFFQCDTENYNNLFGIYEGDFTYQLNFYSNINYDFLLQTNEVCPNLTYCSIPEGYKNSTKGSNMTIMITSLCLNGEISLSLSDSDLNDTYFYSSPYIYIEKSIIKTVIVNFNLNTYLTKVDITLTAYGNLGHKSSCTVSYEPKIPNPIDTLTNINTEIIPTPTQKGEFFLCEEGLDFFQCLSQIFEGEDFLQWLIKILLTIILPIIIIVIVVCCIIQCLPSTISNISSSLSKSLINKK